MRRELTTEYQLFAENRAFALRDNFEILEDELKRLAFLPEMNPTDPDLLQEEQILAGAHAHSVLYNTAVLLLDREGHCVRSVPDRSAFRGQRSATAAWFTAVQGGAAGPLSGSPTRPALGQTLKIVQPVIRGGAFAGALVGIIALAESNLISPAFTRTCRATPTPCWSTEGLERGQVIYPPGRRCRPWGRLGGGDPGLRAGGAARWSVRCAGNRRCSPILPSVAATKFAVVFAWPWRTLTANMRTAGVDAGRDPGVRRRRGDDGGALAVGLPGAAAAGAGRRRDPHRARRAGAGGRAAAPGRDRGDAPRCSGRSSTWRQSIRQRDQELREAAGDAGAAGARPDAEAGRDAGGAGRGGALCGDGQDVGGDRARAEEHAQWPGDGGRADRAGSRQPRRGWRGCGRRWSARSRACATWSIRCCRSPARRASSGRRPIWCR